MDVKFIHDKKYHRNLLCAIMILACLLMANMNLYAQGFQVTGVIHDGNGETLPGVNVVVKGTTYGMVSDVNGSFSITVPNSNAVLLFTFVGYTTQEIIVGEQRQISVTMTEEVSQLDEVVVVGYGTARRSDITGAVASVSSESLMAKAPTSIEQGLQGQVAGVLVSSGGGFNENPTIRVRGTRSMAASTQPLFVVDGVPTTGGMELLNPADVQSMEVLKDASATAIYGVRGANGVILVTTKKGETGRVQVDYNGYVSVGKIDKSRFRRVHNGAEWVEFVRDSFREYIYDEQGGYTIDPSSRYPSETPNYDLDMNTLYFVQDQSGYILESLKRAWLNNNTVYDSSKLREFNWQMQGYRDQALTQSHSVNVRAGTQNTRVMISGSYLDQTGINLNSNNTRYTLRMNLDQTVGKIFSTGGSINFTHGESYNGFNIGTSNSPLASPWYSPGGSGPIGQGGDVTKDGDPKLGLIPNPAGETLAVNPLYDIEGRKNNNKRSNLFLNLYSEFAIMKGLTFRVNFGANLGIAQRQAFSSYYSTTTRLSAPRANQDFDFDRGWTWENILSYNTAIAKDHSLGFTFVQSQQKWFSEPASIQVVGLPIENQIWYGLGNAETKDVTSSYTQQQLMSWMGRFNYGFQSKYLFTGSIRWDGASQLSPGNKWNAFPSFSFAWRISEEDFLKGNPLIFNLKLRAGYGRTGNASVRPYSTMGLIQSSRYTWGSTSPFLGYVPSSLSSPLLGWEYTGQYNVGVDIALLKGRLSGTLDVYHQKTTDLLMLRTLPRVSGFENINENVGETQNQGIEIGINSINFQRQKFQWTTDLQFALNKEKITKLFAGGGDNIGNKWFIGKHIDTYYDYEATPHVWGYSREEMQEIKKFGDNGTTYRPGDMRIKDMNGDYKITDEDRHIRGHRLPNWTVSLTNNFKYGPFDLYIFAYAMVGQTVWWQPGVDYAGRYNTIHVDYWTPYRTNTKYWKPHSGLEQQSNLDAMCFWPGSFLKISDITFGYTLPQSLVQKVGIRNVRAYIKVQNPFLFTKYEGNDPEGNIAQVRGGTRGSTLQRFGGGDGTGRNMNVSDSPKMIYYQLGLNITFN